MPRCVVLDCGALGWCGMESAQGLAYAPGLRRGCKFVFSGHGLAYWVGMCA